MGNRLEVPQGRVVNRFFNGSDSRGTSAGTYAEWEPDTQPRGPRLINIPGDLGTGLPECRDRSLLFKHARLTYGHRLVSHHETNDDELDPRLLDPVSTHSRSPRSGAVGSPIDY